MFEDRKLHVYPLGDLVEHDLDEDCVCGPHLEITQAPVGGDWHQYSHAALDGRE